MDPEITPLDPADRPTLAAVHALTVAAEAVDIPDFPAPCWYEFLGKVTHPVDSSRDERYVIHAGGELVGYLGASLPLRENHDTGDIAVIIHPDHRRRGYGRAGHAFLRDRFRQLGRKRFVGSVVDVLSGGPARHGAGGRFAAAVGAQNALDEVRRRLDLTTVEEATYDALLEQAYAKAGGYQLVTWQDHTPDEYVADAIYLDSRLASDAPMGDLEWEVPEVDVSRRRQREAMLRAGRVRPYCAAALHRDSGRLVAVSVLARTESAPWHAFQWITLVDPEHRGHRLGALVKVENLRFMRRHEPELQMIDTWNAAVNQHMIAINEAMGFRPVDRWQNLQQEV